MLFTRLPSEAEANLEIEIIKALAELRNHAASSEEYGTVVDRIAKLHKLKTEDSPKPVDPNTVILAGTNLLGIALILRHEYLNVLTSKALSFVIKTR